MNHYSSSYFDLNHSRNRTRISSLPLFLQSNPLTKIFVATHEVNRNPSFIFCNHRPPLDLEPLSNCTTVPFISSFRNGMKILQMTSFSLLWRQKVGLKWQRVQPWNLLALDHTEEVADREIVRLQVEQQLVAVARRHLQSC